MAKRTGLLIQFCALFWLGFYPLQSQTDLKESGGSGVLATVVRSGGFAGIHEKFTIFKDGRVVKGSGATFRIPETELNAIIRGMRDLDLPKCCRIEIPESMCSDCFVYRITLRHPSGSRVITLNELGLSGQDRVSTLARTLHALTSRLK